MTAVDKAVQVSLEPAHSPLGASASDRWLACPGSVLATINLPDEDTEYSLQGTAAHWLAEACRGEGYPPHQYLGCRIRVELVSGEDYYVDCDQQMVDGIQNFIDYVASFPGDDYNEERVRYTRFVPNGFGTMDCAKATTKRVRIIDLKYGEGVQVFAKNNSQLMLYALGFFEKHGWLYDIEVFELHIFQPRLNHIDVWEITTWELLLWAADVARPGAAVALAPNAPFAAGEHCTFCKLRRTCGVRATHMQSMIASEMDDLGTLPAVAAMTAEQIIRVIKHRTQISKWLGDVADHAMALIQAGTDVGGWKLVEGRSNRVWGASVEQMGKTLAQQGIDITQFYTEPKLITPPQAEEKFGKALFAPATKKKAAGPLAELIMKPRGSPVLAPPDDPRESILANPELEMEEANGSGDSDF